MKISHANHEEEKALIVLMLKTRGSFILKRPVLNHFRVINFRQRAFITRLYSTSRDEPTKNEPLAERNDEEDTKTPQHVNQPWYLTMAERDKTRDLLTLGSEEINFPAAAPPSLIKITTYLRDELGLKNILIFDLRGENSGDYTTAVAKLSDYVIIGSARSAKHCQKCFSSLNGMIKQEFSSVAYVEGNVNAREERKRMKRLARKANIGKSWGSGSGSTSMSFTKDSEAWFMIDCHVDNIFVNILTEKRRNELNLEELYCPENERPKYRRDNEEKAVSENEMTEPSEESNILAGLRRLAYQRRQYSTSTSSPSAMLSSALNEQDFDGALHIIERNTEFSALPLLQAITDSFANLNVTTNAINEIAQWHKVFETCWPLVLPAETSFQYWSVRLKFLKMLNIANPQLYPCSGIIDDYLIRKKTMGYHLNKDDLLQFLQMIRINLNLVKDGTYWDLVKSNECIVKALRNFNEVEIINDELIISMLLKSMVLENNTSKKLHALYEVIDFLCYQPRSLSSNVIITILETLASIKDWNKFFQFWEEGIKGIIPGQDYRPWAKFIRIIVNSNDIELMQKLIDEGHLLWLKRNEVEMTPGLVEQLNKLFKNVQQNLHDYLDI